MKTAKPARRHAAARTPKKGSCHTGLAAPKAVFHALANEARLCIVRELGEAEEKCVCELVGCCGLGWSTVSHHLSILRDAGIVADEKRGQQVFYRLALPCVTDFILCLQKPDACCKRGCP